jgi:hypothetical protein
MRRPSNWHGFLRPNGLPISRAALIDWYTCKHKTTLQNANDLEAAQRRRLDGRVRRDLPVGYLTCDPKTVNF